VLSGRTPPPPRKLIALHAVGHDFFDSRAAAGWPCLPRAVINIFSSSWRSDLGTFH